MAKNLNRDDVQDQHRNIDIEEPVNINVADNIFNLDGVQDQYRNIEPANINVAGNIVNNNQIIINQNNARAYNVVITDHDAPMVILFGPPSCGKTMTLVRLTRYLSTSGYTFRPDQAFRNATDDEYRALCQNFNAAVGSDRAADGTRYIDFMLLRVTEPHGRTICQFVESPGEFLFNPQDPNAGFPAYLQQIIASRNRKIWLIFLESGMREGDRRAYVNKIRGLHNVIDRRDRIIFVVNKVDLPATSPFILRQTALNMGELFRFVQGLYPGLFETFTVNGIFGRRARYDFTAFQTGTYVRGQDVNGNQYQSFQAGHDSHPSRLWEVIYKCIRG